MRAITTFDQMDWSIRGPWFARGAIVYTMSDLFDTPNGTPPEPTEEDYAENGEHGFDYDGWLEHHPLRRLRAGGLPLCHLRHHQPGADSSSCCQV